MSIEDIYDLEVEGISTTIASYTVDEFVKSYARQLNDLSIDKDTEKINYIITRLIEWYQMNLEKIQQSRFVMNKQNHMKANKLLIDMKNLLDNHKAD